jgi:hypothetical protein
MRSLPVVLVLIASTPAALGQATCAAGAGQPTSIATQNPFAGNNLYGHPNYPNPPGPTYTGFSFLFDLTLNASIDITQIDIDLYDAGGAVNTGTSTVTSPNQVGNTTNIELYLFPAGSYIGNETTPSAWALLGTGTLTVASPHAHSPGVFNPPINLPPGYWGIAFKVDQTTTGLNPGPLHPMLDPNITPPPSYDNPPVSITNLTFQRETWASAPAPSSHSQNIEFHYVPTSGYSSWTSFGTGCTQPNDPVLSLLARPVVGNGVTLQTSNIRSGTQLNFWMFGFAPDPNGFSLTPFGLPGCNLYLQRGGTLITNVTPVTNSVSTVLLMIPNRTSLFGLVVYGQAAPLTPAGLDVSNGVCMAVGLF